MWEVNGEGSGRRGKREKLHLECKTITTSIINHFIKNYCSLMKSLDLCCNVCSYSFTCS